MKTIEVAAGIIEYQDKILCMQRGKDKNEYTSYKWEFPGGKLEVGETGEQALKRELIEEMEMDVDITQFYCDVEHEYPDFKLIMHVFECKTNTPKFVMNVHNDFKWLDLKDLPQLDWAKADRPVVNKLTKENI